MDEEETWRLFLEIITGLLENIRFISKTYSGIIIYRSIIGAKYDYVLFIHPISFRIHLPAFGFFPSVWMRVLMSVSAASVSSVFLKKFSCCFGGGVWLLRRE